VTIPIEVKGNGGLNWTGSYGQNQQTKYELLKKVSHQKLMSNKKLSRQQKNHWCLTIA
jgi:hypothetical protein